MEDNDTGLRRVVDLYVRCSLKVRCFDRRGWAASDSCGHMADTAVKTPNGTLLWRCPEHRGVLYVEGDHEGMSYYRGQPTGPTLTVVPHRAS